MGSNPIILIIIMIKKFNLGSSFIKKNKLKKKFRQWRKFKNIFLNKKKKDRFIKLKSLFNYKHIVWHQIIKLYNKKIKNLIYSKTNSKLILNNSFFKFLTILERRLNIVLLRLRFFSKILEINDYVYKKKIFINNKIRNSNYLIKKGDIINCFSCFTNNYKFFFFKLLKWRRYKWRKWKKNLGKSKSILNLFWLSKINIIYNYIEINYKVFSAGYLQFPVIGEILLSNNKRILVSNTLKKFFYYY